MDGESRLGRAGHPGGHGDGSAKTIFAPQRTVVVEREAHRSAQLFDAFPGPHGYRRPQNPDVVEARGGKRLRLANAANRKPGKAEAFKLAPGDGGCLVDPGLHPGTSVASRALLRCREVRV